MVVFTSIAAGALSISYAVATPLVKRDYPPVGECTGQCEGRLHDPAVIYREDTSTYYRFATNDGINVAIAPSISGPWTFQGAALPGGSSIDLPGNRDLWAPDIFNLGGTYYLYYSVSQIGSMNSDIGVATSQTLDAGDWTDRGSIGIPVSASYNRIDANLYAYDANRLALNFGSFWENIFQLPIQNPPLRVEAAGPLQHLSRNTTARPQGLSIGAQEGAYMFFWQGWHYLFFSAGNCCNTADDLAPAGEEYHILVCRSQDQSGGFMDQGGRDCLTQNGGTLVLAGHDDVYAPGGQGVMWDAREGSVVMYYHYVRPSVSYDYDNFFFGWSKLDFSSGWPVVVA
ncbi:Arabinan endo-1,5-alpha-L-arabinosidase [Cercospora zeina]